MPFEDSTEFCSDLYCILPCISRVLILKWKIAIFGTSLYKSTLPIFIRLNNRITVFMRVNLALGTNMTFKHNTVNNTTVLVYSLFNRWNQQNDGKSGKVKLRLQEQFLCYKIYWRIFICWIKPRLHEQFLCDKFYLFASVRPVYTSNFYLKTKHWRLRSMDDIKKLPILCVVSSDGKFSVSDNYDLPHNTPVFQQI